MAQKRPRPRKPALKGQPLFIYCPSKKAPFRVLEIEHMLEAVARRTVTQRAAEQAMSIVRELLDESNDVY